MRTDTQFIKSIAITALLFTGLTAGSIAQDNTTIVNPETKAPAILTTTPTGGEANVEPSSVIEITFSSEMDETTINENTLILHAASTDSMPEMQVENLDHQTEDRSAIKDSEKSWQQDKDAVKGTVSYSNKVALFTPDEDLKEDAVYTFTVTNGVKSMENIALENEHNWSFTTTGSSDPAYSDKQNASNGTDKYGMDRNEYSESSTDTTQKDKKNMIDLGQAGQFVILAKTTINNESNSRITGRTGEGSVADSLKKEKDDSYSAKQTSPGQIAVLQTNQSDSTSPDVSEAIEDMNSAYNDASMQNRDEVTIHETGGFHSKDLTPGIHEWSDSLHIASDVTISGGENDVWLIKVGNNLTVEENIVFTLSDGAQAENVFWFVEGEVTIGKNAQFEGIILTMNEITLENGAKLNGRMFSQASITLDDNTVTEPRTMTTGQRTSTNR